MVPVLLVKAVYRVSRSKDMFEELEIQFSSVVPEPDPVYFEFASSRRNVSRSCPRAICVACSRPWTGCARSVESSCKLLERDDATRAPSRPGEAESWPNVCSTVIIFIYFLVSYYFVPSSGAAFSAGWRRLPSVAAERL